MRAVAAISATRSVALRERTHLYRGSACRKDASHGTVRITSSGNCRECHRERQQLAAKRHYERNKEQYKQKAAQWDNANRDRKIEIKAKYRETNREQHNAYNRSWFSRNKALRAAYEAARRVSAASTLSKTYASEIHQVYTQCPEGLVVDHVVPLRGKGVSGLHVPWNLQYLTPEANSRKSNRLLDQVSDHSPIQRATPPRQFRRGGCTRQEQVRCTTIA